MRDAKIEALVKRREQSRVPLHDLMARKVQNILLVSSLYDSYTLERGTMEEEGRLSEVVFSDYLDLNLSRAPRVERASDGRQAFEMLKGGHYDLVICMLRMGEMDLQYFSRRAHDVAPEVPVVVLASSLRELTQLEALGHLPHVDRLFLWHGDHRLFFAIIKYVEDRLNVERDTAVAGVNSIILIEDSVRFYSSYLPMLYTELVKQTQAVMTDTVNRIQRLIRMRARPKILLATSYEEGEELYERYRDNVLGVVVDVAFPRKGELDEKAGVEFARMVKRTSPDLPVLLQSSVKSNRKFADLLGAGFIHKQSRKLLAEVRGFMQNHLGFGEFVFRAEDLTEVARARDLRSLSQAVMTVPEESLLHHAGRNHFSTWLMARTEFDLARALRPLKVEDFRSPQALRDYLRNVLLAHRDRARAGVVSEFSSRDLGSPNMFVRIGSGSLGGKGRGLAFVNSLLNNYKVAHHVPGVRVFVPPTAVLATGVFDQFMEDSGLRALVLENLADEEIRKGFMASRLPTDAVRDLRAFLQEVRYPLAVRSSSLLEDATYQPFAGVYQTFMLPNNHPDLKVRLKELANAIKLVYASTFYVDARSYIETTPNRLEEEKMAVVIQQVVGRQHEDYLYPAFAGTARSRNFYPLEGMEADDGIASVALGLGNLVVDGERCLRFSPPHPHRLYQFSSVTATLKNAQREFYALDLSRAGPSGDRAVEPRANLAHLGLDVAEQHGTLAPVGSTYSPDNDAIYDGVSRRGQRLVTMAGVLKGDSFPLSETLSFLLQIGAAGFSGPVEMEFAVNLRSSRNERHEFGFLQVRPLSVGADIQNVTLDGVESDQAICLSNRALGHGLCCDIADVVYVCPETFDRGRTVEIAAEIGVVNSRLSEEERRYVLIGQGRWGSSDRWLGIPVGWSQVSGVGCFVETDMVDASVEPSQGTHFFQNITALGIEYFTVNFGPEGGLVDYEWLDALPAAYEGEFVRHVRLGKTLEVAVDSRSRRGVIMKPGSSVVHKPAD